MRSSLKQRPADLLARRLGELEASVPDDAAPPTDGGDGELEDLVRVARALTQLPPVSPPSAFRRALRGRLLSYPSRDACGG